MLRARNIVLPAFVVVCALFGVTNSGAKETLSVKSAIETARLMLSPEAVSRANPDGAVSVSPDGRLYVFRVIRGDVHRDGVWMELYAGDLRSLDTSAHPTMISRFFTTGLGAGDFEFLGPDLDTSELFNPIRWLDNQRIAFAWSDEHGIRQAVSVDIAKRESRWLTRHPSPVGAFDVDARGIVLYNADATEKLARPARSATQTGFVIPDSADIYSIFRADVWGGTAIDARMNTEWFISSVGSADFERIDIAGRPVDLHNLHEIRFSPNGAWALLNSEPASIPEVWDNYSQREMRAWIAESRLRPRGMMARGVQQFYILDVQTRSSRPLWNAPNVTIVTRAAWSPSGALVLLAPTYLPAETADRRGLDGSAAAVVNVSSGAYEQLPIDLAAMQSVAYLRWVGNDRVVIGEETRTGTTVHGFRRSNGTWLAEQVDTKRERLRITLRQSLQSPPKLHALDTTTGRQRLIFDPNPDLTQRVALGRVEKIGGTVRSGDEWQALLFYPLNYTQGRRYPLVIQSVYEPITSHFTLYGSTPLGPPEIAPYPGQVLANRDIFVLHLNLRIGAKANTPAEAEARMAAFEELPKRLSDAGLLIDLRRIGLLGFSRNGYYVEYTLTHSKMPFAAAVSADGFDASYMPITMMGDIVNGTAMIGQPPFGNGLREWLERAPGFNAEKLSTPLRKIQQSFGMFGVLLNWELFSRLRYLKKPVELYVVPDYEHGAHNTQNPAQIVAVQQGVVDWFDFWLNDFEDPAVDKREQYLRWRHLRDLSTSAPSTE